MELFDQKGPQRVCNMTMRIYLSSQFHIPLIEFYQTLSNQHESGVPQQEKANHFVKLLFFKDFKPIYNK